MNKKTLRRPAGFRQTILITAAIGLLMSLAVLLAACGGGNGGATTTSGGGQTTQPSSSTTQTTLASETTTTTGGTTTTEKLSSAESISSDGSIKAMGYINKVWVSGGVRYISIDYAEMLTGAAAQKAAQAAGEIGPGEDLPNDYFIQNTSKQLRQFKVSNSATIRTATWGGGTADTPVAITWTQFASFWQATPPVDAAHMHQVPWWITRNGDTVTSITEQYLP
jgi:hypothetical protein